jgi:predicted TIM-barrel fold metal-dependent hydrolase
MTDQQIKLNKDEVVRLLSYAKSIKGSHHFYDMHVHPFEIVFTKGSYQANEQQTGVFSTAQKPFTPPQLSEVIIEQAVDKTGIENLPLRPAIYRMKFSSLYTHTGPEVFNLQMVLSMIDRILLLPVATPDIDVYSQMDDMKRIFEDDSRFYMGWSVSNSISNDEIFREATAAVKNYNVCSVKLNLSQMEIDISEPRGKKRIELILDACVKLNLPVILHGGRSPLAKTQKISQYGEIETFELFNWSRYDIPVIFAHSAAYGYSAKEIKSFIIPRLKKMFSDHSNILIDISGVDINGLQEVLEVISIDRILFGSDALYEPQWQRMAKLIYALDRSTQDTEESLIKIMSLNPEKYIFSQIDREN